jgi:lipoprotein-anchoring transpeptidase ErfK/SrfK
MIRVGVREASVSTGRFWRIALLTLAVAIGTASEADAALYYWPGYYDPGYYYQPAPTFPQRRPKVRRNQAKTIEAPGKESTKPQGPLIIAISIDRQSLKLFDANGFFAETPISTGMVSHPTPMGVFSVIQKHKFHRSNIYSNAPMPYMQRITWSGVAMHAGVLPGYPASHGCIRMPMAFAVKMWGWTRMGARVVITPGEITPSSISHPLLATQKVVPKPTAANEPEADAPPAAKADKAADARPKPMTLEAALELRSTVGHNNSQKPVSAGQAATPPLSVQTHTASASGDGPATKTSVTVSDAAPSGGASAVDVVSKSGDDKPANAAKLEAPASESVKAEGKPIESIKTVTEVGPSAPDLQQDKTRAPDNEKAAAPKPDPAATATAPKRTGQIAAFISRKDSRLYVRQNFAPWFDLPVTIAPSDRLLGTHVFTAQVDKNDANLLRWSVVSLPMPARYSERHYEDERVSRRRKLAGAAEIKALPGPDSPAQALDRLTVPADAMARITEALSTGGSIIVSDQGINASETGEGTDFIVSLR